MKYVAGWKKEFIHQLKLGRPETLAARLVKIGLDRVIFERNRDPEFAQSVDEAKANHFKSTQY
jgi:hypothetical protein